MPRYFFDLHDGVLRFPDDFGDDFNDFEEARQHVQVILADIARDAMPGGDERSFSCELRDEAHDLVYRGRLFYKGEMHPSPDASAIPEDRLEYPVALQKSW